MPSARGRKCGKKYKTVEASRNCTAMCMQVVKRGKWKLSCFFFSPNIHLLYYHVGQLKFLPPASAHGRPTTEIETEKRYHEAMSKMLIRDALMTFRSARLHPDAEAPVLPATLSSSLVLRVLLRFRFRLSLPVRPVSSSSVKASSDPRGSISTSSLAEAVE